jgi:protein phosphatase 2C family protein 2/3
VVSTALLGERLRAVTLEELKANAEEKTRAKAERLKTRRDVQIEKAKVSLKEAGVVEAYAANTNQGLVRGYNEDRVSIILNILKPESRKSENWPKCSFFGLYDGHGGSGCADYLRDNLHQFVIKQSCFPWNPK